MRALNIKLLRDLWSIRGQAIAIVFVVIAGVATYIMFLSTLSSLTITQAHYYDDYRFAHVFSSLKRAPESVKQRIEAIAGVVHVDTRVVANVNLDIEGFAEPVTGRLVSIPEGKEALLNKLFMRKGRLVDAGRDDEVILSETFANAHRLVVGDHVKAIINGRYKKLTIVGLALSPEYIHQLRPGSAFPDYKRYGILWMGREALASAYDMQGAFNDIAISISKDGNELTIIEQLDDVLAAYGGTGAYGRDDQFSNRFLTQELKNLANNARMFPMIFIAVAIFLLNVVAGRIVSMQREQIAALKAFGYGNVSICLHYFLMVLIIVVIGVSIGIATGIWLGQGMSYLYMDFFSFPYLNYHLENSVIISAVIINLLSAIVAAYFAVRRAMLLQPAEAMRPEPPVKYTVSWFERMGVGGWLNQPNRMIIRHISRRPVKSALTVLGIAFACGILMTGRFQQDTVSYMMDIQYNLMQRDDLALVFNEPTSRRVLFELQSLPGVEHAEVLRQVSVELSYGHRKHRTGILGLEPNAQLQRLMDVNLKPISMPEAGMIMTDYLAEMLGVAVGDEVVVKVMEGNRLSHSVPVVGLVNEYMGVSAYMDMQSLNRLLKEGDAVSGAKLQLDEQYLQSLFDYFKTVPAIASTLERKQEIVNFNKTMDETMIFVTMVATVFSSVIAFGVVYNSARIALAERSRELASLRVLGFTRGEISYILLGELTLLALCAIPLGFVAGYMLCAAIALGLQSELYRVPVIISLQTYAFAGAVVFVASFLSALVVRRKLDNLDLIAALKTKE